MAHSTADLVIGVDAGGTKTHALVCDRKGHVLGFGTGGASNWEGVGTDGTAAALRAAVGGALSAAGAPVDAVSAAAYGLAGLDWPSDEPLLGAVVDGLAIGGPRVLVNDSFVALRAGCRGAGIVSSAGTGTVAAGRNRAGRTFRTMAIGYGERGGSGDLKQAALHAVAREYHGSGSKTALTATILTATGTTSIPELFEGLTRRHLRLPDDLPRLVLELAGSGDAPAAAIARDFGRELAEAAAGVARRLDMIGEPFQLVRSGGMQLAGCRTLDAGFHETAATLLPTATVVHLTAPPVIGAVLLALELGGPVPESVEARLAAEATVAPVAGTDPERAVTRARPRTGTGDTRAAARKTREA